MPSQARLVIGLFVLAAVLGLLNLLVWRRATSAFGLSRRGRRGLAVALAVPLAGMLLFRVLGAWIPVGSGESIAVAVSAAELGVIIAASLLGLGALASAGGRAARRAWMWRKGAPGREESTRGALKGSSMALPGTPGCPDSATAENSGTPECPEELSGDRSGHPQVPPKVSEAFSGHPQVPPKVSEVSSGHPQVPPPGAPALSRRVFVEQAAVGSALLVGGGSTAYGAMFGRHDYELSTVPVPIPGLSKAADGFTIVQLSDIHLGQMVGEAEMRAAEELVRKAKGDLIVLTGDLVDHDVRFTGQLGRLVRRLGAIRPVVAIPGNHDYYTGIDEVLATLRDAGATTLVNESTWMLGERDGFVLVGLDDPWGARRGPEGGSRLPPARGVRSGEVGRGPDLAAALADVRSDAPRIVLCHNPQVFVDTAGQVALQIAGHTHGGQVNLGLRPADYVLRHGYIAGLYRTNGSHLYVNRGFGTAGPAVRVGAPPEVSRLVLVAA